MRTCSTFDGRLINYEFGDLDMLVPAYATTIHKSQGSEYPAVVIPVMTQHYAMATESSLHRRHTRQTAGRLGRSEEGSRYSSAQRVRSPALIETARMVVSETGCPTGLSGYCRPAIPLNPSDRRA
jgi:hypothetical protein